MHAYGALLLQLTAGPFNRVEHVIGRVAAVGHPEEVDVICSVRTGIRILNVVVAGNILREVLLNFLVIRCALLVGRVLGSAY